MFYAKEFWFKTWRKALPEAPDVEAESSLNEAVVIFFQAEAKDSEEGREPAVVTKLVKNAKWLAGKFATRRVVFHSFNHLGTSRAAPELAERIVSQAMERLQASAFEVAATPFGYLNEWRMHVAGESLAKVYKEI